MSKEVKSKPKRRVTEKLVERVKTITTNIWIRVSAEVIGESNELITIDEERQKASDRYKEELTKLSTKILEDILIVHYAGRYKRREDTIEAINMELARRALLGDNSGCES